MLLLSMSASDPKEAAALRRLADGDDGAEPADADLLDLLEAFASARPRLADLVKSLPALKPRLYSIASSLRAEPGQVHLCVGVVNVQRRGRVRLGVASTFLAHRAAEHGEILQERAALKHTGPTWLFFGDQHEKSDFLFEPELRGYLADGTLSRLDTAWSRDQAKKVYVQNRMTEHAADLWRWLQDGAYFYVCGDAMRMAKDVDATLRAVAAKQGGLDEAQAKDWMVALARQGRYLRDVY